MKELTTDELEVEELRQYWRDLGALAQECERELEGEEWQMSERDRKTLAWLRGFGRLCRDLTRDDDATNDNQN